MNALLTEHVDTLETLILSNMEDFDYSGSVDLVSVPPRLKHLMGLAYGRGSAGLKP